MVARITCNPACGHSVPCAYPFAVFLRALARARDDECDRR